MSRLHKFLFSPRFSYVESFVIYLVVSTVLPFAR